MIKVSHVSKQYGSFQAVKNLSFHMEAGRIYGLLGPNGAGKSTTMNMITGYLAPSSGKICVNGHDIAKEPQEAKRCIGYLAEIPPLYTEMTVGEYLRSVAQMKGIGRTQIKEEIERAMTQVFIADRKDRLIRNLSKGYRQRVGIAQALLGDPQIIILDEPTVGLDPKQILEIRDLIRSLSKRHTVILSSHILSEVAQVCDDVLIINQGKLVAKGSAAMLEQQMAGAGILHLVAEGEQDKIREILEGIAQIRRAEMVPWEDGQPAEKKEMPGEAFASQAQDEDKRMDETLRTNVWDIRLHIAADTDIRRDLFYRFAQAHCPILEMTRERHSLEEIFLTLTGEEES